MSERLNPKPRRWTKETVIEALRLHYTTPGRKPYDGVLARAARRLFGDMHAARHAAGLAPRRRRQRKWTRETVLEAIRRLATIDRPVTSPPDDPGLRGAAVRYFGNWRAAAEAADLKPRPRPATAESTLAKLRELVASGGSLACVDNQTLAKNAKRWSGGWNNGLRMAGVPVEPRHRWTRVEVVEWLQRRIREGGSLRAIWRTHPRLFYAATRIWGTWTAALIEIGAAPTIRRRWTRATILATLRRAPKEQRTSVFRGNPSMKVAATREFGGVEAAWLAAGIVLPRRIWTAERVVEAIQDGYRSGRLVRTTTDWEKPLVDAARRQYGSWRQAVQSAGLSSRLGPPPTRWTRQSVVEAIRRLDDAAIHRARYEQKQLVSAARAHFGRWNAALEAAGRSPSRRFWSRRAVISEIRKRQRKGRPLDSRIFREHPALGGAASRLFGNWRKALRAAGVDPATVLRAFHGRRRGSRT